MVIFLGIGAAVMAGVATLFAAVSAAFLSVVGIIAGLIVIPTTIGGIIAGATTLFAMTSAALTGLSVAGVVTGLTAILAAPIIGSVTALIAAVPGCLAAIGFGTVGIVAGSFAGAWQAIIGNVVSGSIFATLQAAGATGSVLTMIAKLVIFIITAPFIFFFSRI